MLDLDLHGRIALVSGSTAGIGYAVAAALAAQGAHVIITGRTQARVDAAIAQIAQSDPSAELSGVAADLATAAGADAVIARFPQVDVLVNNVATFDPVPFADISDAEWTRFFETNVMSGVRLTRAYLPGMRERNWGRVVFVSSESGVQIPAEMIHYGVTKTAQIALARGIAESVAGTGITVNSVLPGPTLSEGLGTFVDALAKQQHVTLAEFEKNFFRTVRPSSILGRFTTTQEVANMIAYVCSPAASATTGAALRVDGGVVRAIP